VRRLTPSHEFTEIPSFHIGKDPSSAVLADDKQLLRNYTKTMIRKKGFVALSGNYFEPRV